MSNEIVKPDGGFPLPEVIDPPRICVMLQIPDDPQHIRAFWGALFELTRWFNWERDAEHKGKPVADVWLDVFLQSHANYLESCMFDPCCPETNELLEAIRVLNLTIVNNQITMIDNDTTIINQNLTAEYNQYVNQYNQFLTNNQNTQIFNEMIYDGTPQSIYPEAGENFNSTGDGILCDAIQTYINGQIYIHSSRANLAAGAAGVISAAVLAFAAAAALVTGGASIVAGLAIGSAIVLGQQAWLDILQDPEAQRKVRCCMYDALKDQALTYENFQISVDSCGFDSGTHESSLAAQIAADNFNYPENFTAFIRAMSQSAGNDPENCECGCDPAELEIISLNDCVVTRVDDTHWLVTQTNSAPHPFDPEKIGFRAIIKDQFDRCFNVVGGVGTASSDYTQTNCEGVVSSGTGGGGGLVVLLNWVKYEYITEPGGGIYVTLEIICP